MMILSRWLSHAPTAKLMGRIPPMPRLQYQLRHSWRICLTPIIEGFFNGNTTKKERQEAGKAKGTTAKGWTGIKCNKRGRRFPIERKRWVKLVVGSLGDQGCIVLRGVRWEDLLLYLCLYYWIIGLGDLIFRSLSLKIRRNTYELMLLLNWLEILLLD